jgi:hypothetical protein
MPHTYGQSIERVNPLLGSDSKQRGSYANESNPNNRGTTINGVFYAVRAEGCSWEPVGNEVNAEAEESSLIEAVT